MNPFRSTIIDARSPKARNQRLRGASFDVDGNVTGGKDSLSGSQVTVPTRTREPFKTAPAMGDGMKFFETNKSQPQMRPMTGPTSPRGQEQTMSRLRDVVAEARRGQSQMPTGATVSSATDGVNTMRSVAGKYGSGTAQTGPLATSTVAKEQTQFLPTPAADGVSGIMDGYRDSLKKKPLQPQGKRMNFRELANL